MKRNIFAILILFCMIFVTEANAQRRGYRYRYAPPRPYVRVVPRVIVPRIVVPPPAIGFSWGYRPRVYIVPPPIIIGGGRGWRHYHRRGYDCNDRCHCWSDDHYYRERERRYYDDRRDYYDDRDRRYNEDNRNRRYYDNDRYYNRLEDTRQQADPRTYNTDEDFYEDEPDTV
ncbi:hypothetical protein [Emticicia sp. 17c]|uniref:hypothetical protein n=1 Tax=Emticicia sp. 17c TaxID=3127704 RepID=UPI00301B8497